MRPFFMAEETTKADLIAQELRRILEERYRPASDESGDFKAPTSVVFRRLQEIYPAAYDPSDVYNLLRSMNYRIVENEDHDLVWVFSQK